MRSRRERGGVAILIAVTIPTIVAIGAGLILIGRITSLRQRQQYATDAVAAAGALLAKRQGLASSVAPNVQSAAYTWLPSAAATQAMLVAARNGNLPIGGAQPNPTWSMQRLADGSDWAYSSVTMQRSGLGVTFNTQAQYRIAQIRSATPHIRAEGLVLVLDYSTSMLYPKAPNVTKPITELYNAAQQFISDFSAPDYNQYLQLGLVVYGSNVSFYTTQPEPYATSQFQDIANNIDQDAKGNTDTGDGIAYATTQLLNMTENTGRNIVLFTDGTPCNGTGNSCDEAAGITAAVQAANEAKSSEVEIITVYVQSKSSPAPADVVGTFSSIASPGGPGSTMYCIGPYCDGFPEADTIETIFNNLEKSIIQTTLCDLTPPAGVDPNDCHAFLRTESSGVERPLLLYASSAALNVAGNPGLYGYAIQASPPRVIFSAQACQDVLTSNGAVDAVIRWGRPVLAH